MEQLTDVFYLAMMIHGLYMHVLRHLVDIATVDWDFPWYGFSRFIYSTVSKDVNDG